jgi:tRNA-dihydrouridine synthase B
MTLRRLLHRFMSMDKLGFRIGQTFVPSRVVMAPLAGLTNQPFRLVAAEAGCHVFWTEMISSEGLVRKCQEITRLLPNPLDPHPVAVQLFGADPAVMAEAAAMAVAAGGDLLDINMACPVRRLSRVGAGAALMRDPHKAANLVRAVASRIDLPVTVKIRLGWDAFQLNVLDVARAVRDAGAAAIIIHGRTRAQGFTGRADHSMAALLARELDLPVIVSGDITTGKDAHRVLEETQAAAVMIGRAAIGNPWIFRAVERYLEDGSMTPGPGDEERLAVMVRHLDLLVEVSEERRAVGLFRPHLVRYLRARADASRWRKELLAVREAGALVDELRRIVRGSA